MAVSPSFEGLSTSLSRPPCLQDNVVTNFPWKCDEHHTLARFWILSPEYVPHRLAARDAPGLIDLDPASGKQAQETFS